MSYIICHFRLALLSNEKGEHIMEVTDNVDNTSSTSSKIVGAKRRSMSAGRSGNNKISKVQARGKQLDLTEMFSKA